MKIKAFSGYKVQKQCSIKISSNIHLPPGILQAKQMIVALAANEAQTSHMAVLIQPPNDQWYREKSSTPPKHYQRNPAFSLKVFCLQDWLSYDFYFEVVFQTCSNTKKVFSFTTQVFIHIDKSVFPPEPANLNKQVKHTTVENPTLIDFFRQVSSVLCYYCCFAACLYKAAL